jgi:hypothetical protein
LRQVLADCEQLATDASLRAVFANSSLAPWRSNLPQANSIQNRAEYVIDYLHNKYSQDGDNVLVQLLLVLSEYVNEKDQQHHDLLALANDLNQTLGQTK